MNPEFRSYWPMLRPCPYCLLCMAHTHVVSRDNAEQEPVA